LFHALFESENRPQLSCSRTLVVGIGSPHGDDQAGWLVAERLADDPGIGTESVLKGTKASGHCPTVIVRKATSPGELLVWLDGLDRLVICDACRGLGRVGAVREWTWPVHEFADAAWSGTHDLPLPAVLELAQRLRRLPPRVTIWSVEGASNDALAAVSPEVAAALPSLVDQIKNELTK
jgi:hydrogenase maturation protease